MGLTLFAEYIDAVAVGTIDTTQTLGTLTVNSAAGSKSGDTKVTITPAKANAGNAYKYKVASSETARSRGLRTDVKNWSAWMANPILQQQQGRLSRWLSVTAPTGT